MAQQLSDHPFPKIIKPSAEEVKLLQQIDRERLPHHVAIIMDGNGRWAKKRGLPRVAGHREGIKSVRRMVEASAQLEIAYLTLYAFSAENWQRPPSEVSYLMGLIEEYIFKELTLLIKNNVRFQVLGRMHELAPSVREKLEKAIAQTADNTGLNFNVALNYGSRIEIMDAVKQICRKVTEGHLAIDNIDEKQISQHLYTANQPDPDLLIRTSGEFRISNFLLWQLAYAEIYVTPVFWPDFKRANLFRAIIEYQGRERRFGRVLSP